MNRKENLLSQIGKIWEQLEQEENRREFLNLKVKPVGLEEKGWPLTRLQRRIGTWVGSYIRGVCMIGPTASLLQKIRPHPIPIKESLELKSYFWEEDRLMKRVDSLLEKTEELRFNRQQSFAYTRWVYATSVWELLERSRSKSPSVAEPVVSMARRMLLRGAQLTQEQATDLLWVNQLASDILSGKLEEALLRDQLETFINNSPRNKIP